MDLAQIVIAIFLLLLGGAGAFVMGRITKISDALAAAETALAVAVNNIKHLKEKTLTHTDHIDTLFDMKASVAKTEAAVELMAQSMPQMLDLMKQLAQIALRKQAA